MKSLILTLLAVLALAPVATAADGDLFPYPKPPEDMSGLTERCDFLVGRFWNQCDFKGAMSKKDKFDNTFGDWISFMPYATADTVHAAIDRLIKKNEKNGPVTLELARMAEKWAHSDTTDTYSDEIFLPFAKAAATHKKIPAAERARFESQVKIMENTVLGQPVGHLDYVKTDGTKASLADTRTQLIVLFFNDHECDDCNMARVRLSADINATALIKAGVLTVLSIEPGDASTEWLAAAASYPQEWIIGSSADADEYFSLREFPSIYLLDSRHRLLAKEMNIDSLLATLAAIRTSQGY